MTVYTLHHFEQDNRNSLEPVEKNATSSSGVRLLVSSFTYITPAKLPRDRTKTTVCGMVSSDIRAGQKCVMNPVT